MAVAFPVAVAGIPGRFGIRVVARSPLGGERDGAAAVSVADAVGFAGARFAGIGGSGAITIALASIVAGAGNPVVTGGPRRRRIGHAEAVLASGVGGACVCRAFQGGARTGAFAIASVVVGATGVEEHSSPVTSARVGVTGGVTSSVTVSVAV